MAPKKKLFKANLIKYKDPGSHNYLWFWINPTSGTIISPQFSSQKNAEKWFDDLMIIHNETYDLLDRVKNGMFYTVKGVIDVGDTLSSVRTGECPFTVHIEDDTIEIEVLATSVSDARKRVEGYFEILEWID